MTHEKKIQTVGIFSNYVPIQCGISTFAKNLFESIAGQRVSTKVSVIGVNDSEASLRFPSEVGFEVAKERRSDYIRAAEYVNSSDIDAICIQHEFGIFGGPYGVYILDFVRRLEKPFAITLHTVLESPCPDQRGILAELARRASAVIVMSRKAVDMLTRVYGVAPEKVNMIHHGVPNSLSVSAGWENNKQPGANLLTFGLLSPDKGIEYVIEALPQIVEKRPDAIYRIVGATHPHIKRDYGESYRESLVSLAENLGLGEHVQFENRFLNPCEIVEYLEEADVYVTPYLKEEQITSGTLAYAVGSGKVVISTPYWYAKEILASDRGLLVPVRNAQAIATAALSVLTDKERFDQIQRNTRTMGRTMSWREIGSQYLALFDRIYQEPKLAIAAKSDKLTVPELHLGHLRHLTDDTGILQHARYSVPRLSEGYCLDDNARALLLTGLVHQSFEAPPADIDDLSSKYLAFVAYALDSDIGKFRNFMSFNGEWLESTGSEDSQGRALWCLAGFAVRSKNRSQTECAIEIFEEALSASLTWTSPRAWAYAILGLAQLHGSLFSCRRHEAIMISLANQLRNLHQAVATKEWDWFEPCASYCNARLPHAMIAAGNVLGERQYSDCGLKTLTWLWNLQEGKGGRFEPLGCQTPYRVGMPKPLFDQQPVETYTMLSACIEAGMATGESIWIDRAWQSFRWFLGENSLGVPLFDSESGGCFDGLSEYSVNKNQGAESTLSFLMACEEMRQLLPASATGRESAMVM